MGKDEREAFDADSAGTRKDIGGQGEGEVGGPGINRVSPPPTVASRVDDLQGCPLVPVLLIRGRRAQPGGMTRKSVGIQHVTAESRVVSTLACV